MTTVLVTGGRNYHDRAKVFATLDELMQTKPFQLLIHGNADGADRLARFWAQERGVEQRAFPADWERYGKSAGGRRNVQMLKEGRPDLVVAFPGGSGTAHMVEIALAAGVPVRNIKDERAPAKERVNPSTCGCGRQVYRKPGAE